VGKSEELERKARFFAKQKMRQYDRENLNAAARPSAVLRRGAANYLQMVYTKKPDPFFKEAHDVF
jgi:hypothetical protein